MRLTQKSDPWNGNSSTFINSNINYTYDGRHVDLVVGDDGVWIGHPEFINTGNGQEIRLAYIHLDIVSDKHRISRFSYIFW